MMGLVLFQLLVIKLNQVPQISVQIFKDGDGSVTFFLRFADKADAERNHFAVIAPEIVGSQKQKDTPTGLATDEGILFRRSGSRQQQRRFARSRRSHSHPAFVLCGLVCVFDQREVKFARVKLYGFVVISNDQRDVSNGLFHVQKMMIVVWWIDPTLLEQTLPENLHWKHAGSKFCYALYD